MTGAAELHTQHLDLEPVRAAHAQEAWPQLDDDRMWRYFPALRPATTNDLRRLYEKWERGSPEPEQVWLNWLCRERSLGFLAGSMQATVFPQRRTAYVAYAIYPAHQRKGYAREAVRTIIAYVGKTYRVKRFVAQMDTRNEPSFRLVEALGFVRIGTRRATDLGQGSGAHEYSYELTL